MMRNYSPPHVTSVGSGVCDLCELTFPTFSIFSNGVSSHGQTLECQSFLNNLETGLGVGRRLPHHPASHKL